MLPGILFAMPRYGWPWPKVGQTWVESRPNVSRKWPMANGHWPWPLTIANVGHGHWPRANVGHGHGQWPWRNGLGKAGLARMAWPGNIHYWLFHRTLMFYHTRLLCSTHRRGQIANQVAGQLASQLLGILN